MKKKLIITCLTVAIINIAGAQPFSLTGSVIETNSAAHEIKFWGPVSTPSTAIKTFRGNTENYLELISGLNGSDIILHGSASSLPGAVQLRSHGADDDNTGFEYRNLPSYSFLFGVKRNGNVHFKDVVLQHNPAGIKTLRFNTHNTNSYVELYSGSDANDGGAIFMHSKNSPYTASRGGVEVWANELSNGNHMAFQVLRQPSHTSLMYLRQNGNLGLGDNDPEYTLSVNGDMTFTESSTTRALRGRTTDGLEIHSHGGDPADLSYNVGSTIRMESHNNGGGIFFSGYNQAATTQLDRAYTFETRNYAQLSWPLPTPDRRSHMTIRKNGKVVIGDVLNYISVSNTALLGGDYKLYVQTGILTEKVKVALSNDPNNWSDFVFADDYKLRSLDEVEDFIKENKHLPEIPSTEEVHREGLDLAQMDAKLLQKIEELTLYIIELKKENDKQAQQIQRLIKK